MDKPTRTGDKPKPTSSQGEPWAVLGDANVRGETAACPTGLAGPAQPGARSGEGAGTNDDDQAAGTPEGKVQVERLEGRQGADDED